MSKQFKRSGDHNFHEISEEVFNKLTKNATNIKHNGKFVFGVGEASNHNHIITVKRPTDMIIKQNDDGVMFFQLKTDGKLSHEIGDTTKIADHKTIPIIKKFYVHIQEREQDIFSRSVRKVVD